MSFAIKNIPEQRKVNGLDFPLLIEPSDNTTATDKQRFLEWVNTNDAQLHEKLIQHGAILFRGFPVQSADDFEAMLNNSQYKNMPYVGGAAPRNQVTETRIITANESPATEKIPFHHEMAQVPNPPGYIFFYCDIASPTGGATSILHSAEICEKFKAIDTDFFEKVKEQGVRYVRVMPEETDKQSAIGRSWKETFQVTNKIDAEKVMQEAGMRWQWLDNGNIRTETKTLPAIRHDQETANEVFFNAMVVVYTGWNDSRNNGETAVVTGDGEYLNHEVMQALVKEMDDTCVNFPWQNGDVLWINNYTTLHARQPFSGDRRILASIAYK